MRVGFCADVHIDNHKLLGGEVRSGLNDRCKASITVLGDALNLAADQGCSKFVLLGDLFDQDRPLPQVIAAVQDVLVAHDKMEKYLVVGNHEQRSEDPGDHALGPLAGYAEVVERPTVLGLGGEGMVVLLPWTNTPTREWLPKALASTCVKPTKPVVVGAHFGIIDEETPSWLKAASDGMRADVLETLCDKHGIHSLISGHWHERGIWSSSSTDGPRVIQIGALVPTGWDNPGVVGYGTLAIFDTATQVWTFKEVPGPRFVALRDSQSIAGNGLGNSLFVRITADPENIDEALATLDAAKAAGKVVGGFVLPSTHDAQVAARTAAKAARSSDTLKDAVQSFVKEMPIAPGVDRSKVLDMSLRFLGKE